MHTKINFAILAVYSLVFAVVAQGQQAVIPIVQGNYLLGGTQNGRWVSAEAVGKGLGEAVELKQIELNSTNAKNATGRTGEKWDACPDQAIVKIEDEDADEMSGLFVGAGAAWNLVPRKPVEVSVKNAAYVRIARTFLRGKGISRSPVKLTQVIEVDLDGDGTKEALISGTYFRKPLELSYGDYSFTFIRYNVGKSTKDLLIDGQFLSRSLEFDLAEHRVAAVADANGDGRMEIALSVTHSESDEQMLFEYNAGKLEKRFEATCGA